MTVRRLASVSATRYDQRVVVGTLLTVFLTTMVVTLIPGLPAVVSAPPIVVVLSLIPGALALLLLMDEPTVDASFVVLSVGVSLLLIMGLGVLLNLALPLGGIDRPMSLVYLILGTSTLVGVLGTGAYYRADGEVLLLPAIDFELRNLLAFALLPLWSVIALDVLNGTGRNEPLLFVLGLVALVPLVGSLAPSDDWRAFGIWSLALAVLYHDSLWVYSNFGGSPGVIRAWEVQRWTPGTVEADATSTTLLENGVLFPTFARLSGVDILTHMEVIHPFLVAFIPLAMFVMFRRCVDAKSAFVAVMLFIFAHPFYLQYPTVGRATMPVLFLVLIGVIVTDRTIETVPSSLLLLLFATGVVTTHYGTAYYVMATLLGGMALSWCYRVLDKYGPVNESGDCAPGTDSLVEMLQGSVMISRKLGNKLSVSFGLYYSTAAIAWYLFTVEGAKFALFPQHSYKILDQFFRGALFIGGSTQRLQRTYGGEAIELSKGLYVGFIVLIGIGILLQHYRRFLTEGDISFDDEYLAVASVLFGLFGITAIFRTWGGGRPLMITLSFTAVFGVSGISWCVTRVHEVVGQGNPVLGSLDGPLSGRKLGRAVFAVLLAVFFLLNTGTASVVLLDGRAPNNVPLHPQIDESENPDVRSSLYRITDVEAHVWINEKNPSSPNVAGKVYGDELAHGQVDWYRPAIELRTEGHSAYYDIQKPRGNIVGFKNASQPGYVLLLGHNLRMQLLVTAEGVVSLRRISTPLSNSNLVYNSGNSHVYFRANSTSDAVDGGTAD